MSGAADFGRPLEWNAPQLVLHMSRLTAVVLLLTPIAFLTSPLTADDLYGAPDPGWYNAGSGWSRDRGPPSGYDTPDYGGAYEADGYDYDRGWSDSVGDRGIDADYSYRGWGYDEPPSPDYRYQDGAVAADRYGYDRYPGRGETWRPSEQRRETPEPLSPDGYGAPDWAQQQLPPSVESYQRRPPPPGYRDGTALGESIYREPSRDAWRAPPSRQAYRFREDPDLEQPIGGGSASGYRFRPLTRNEQERSRAASPDYRVAEPARDRRFRPRDDEERGTAFGYAPGPSPQDDFYRRYYRSGP